MTDEMMQFDTHRLVVPQERRELRQTVGGIEAQIGKILA